MSSSLLRYGVLRASTAWSLVRRIGRGSCATHLPALEPAWLASKGAGPTVLGGEGPTAKGFGLVAGWDRLRLPPSSTLLNSSSGREAEDRRGGPETTSEAKGDGNGGKGSGTGGDDGGPGGSPETRWIRQLALFAGLLLGLAFFTSNSESQRKEISFHSFLWDLVLAGKVDKVEVVDKSYARVYLKPGAQVLGLTPPATGTESWAPYYFTLGTIDSFEKKLEEAQEDAGIDPNDFVRVTYNNNPDTTITGELLKAAPSILVVLALLWMLRGGISNIPGVGGRNIFQVGKANPIIVKGGEKTGKEITFADVAGLDEAKLEVNEFVDFLKNPRRYQKLGANIPKGALLVGPPGTGKTLLAKACAGEANVPFFSMSGSDFIEMFVGVGPSRVRDLFQQARQQAPCIVFIDEIDAVGRARGRGGFSGGNDERENTLNALLVEMDGFSSTSGVVVLAGTNRADILDKALLRPGRFDRMVAVDKPDIRGRYQIFMVHLKALRLAVSSDIIAKRMASLTPGFTGADIANVCNEGALVAARHGKLQVELADFEAATDRVVGGLEKKNKVISRKEREIVAHHEAGHAVVGWFSKHADPVLKVSIIPRGSAALGFSQHLPQDRKLMSTEQLNDFIVTALGGRVAEQLCFNSVTTGATDDLQRVTKAVYAQVSKYGFSDKLGKVFYPADNERQEMYKPYSEETAQIIDEEARRLVENSRIRCEKLLKEKLPMVKALAQRLLEKEVAHEEDLVEILGPRKFAKPSDYDSVVQRFEDDRLERTKRQKLQGNTPKGSKAKTGGKDDASNVELELA